MTKLSVVTYNVKMFPPLGKLGIDTSYEKSESDEARMARIITLVTSRVPKPDIISFQEVFDNDRQAQCRRLLSALGYDSTEKLDDGDLFHEDSGLLVAVNKSTFRWNRRYFYVEYNDHTGADAWADKGVVGLILDSVTSPGTRVVFFATHTQADTDHSDIRQKQFAQARRHIERVVGKMDAAVLFAGDLNVVGETPEYPQMLTALRYPRDLYREAYPNAAENPGDTWDGPGNSMTPGTATERLDYLFAFNNLPEEDPRNLGRPLRNVVCDAISVEKFGNASDHYGLSAQLTV